MSSLLLLVAGWALVAVGGWWPRRLGLSPRARARIVAVCAAVGLAMIVFGLVTLAVPTVLRAVGAAGAAASCRHVLGFGALGSEAVGWCAAALVVVVVWRAVIAVASAYRSVRASRVEPWLGRHEDRGDFDLVILPTDRLLAMSVPRRRAQVVISQGLVDCLEPGELEAVIRHEDAHRRHHHPRYALVALVAGRALAPLPGAGHSAAALRDALEMWADDAAAGPRRSSRSVVRDAILALSRSGPGADGAGRVNGRQIAERLRTLGNGAPAPSLALRCSVAAPLLAMTAIVTMTVAIRLASSHHGSVLGIFC